MSAIVPGTTHSPRMRNISGDVEMISGANLPPNSTLAQSQSAHLPCIRKRASHRPVNLPRSSPSCRLRSSAWSLHVAYSTANSTLFLQSLSRPRPAFKTGSQSILYSEYRDHSLWFSISSFSLFDLGTMNKHFSFNQSRQFHRPSLEWPMSCKYFHNYPSNLLNILSTII